MKNIATNIIETANKTVIQLKEPDEYGVILMEHQFNYTTLDRYLQVGEVTWTQGWILHISIIRIQIPSLLNTILPILKKEQTPFKIAKTPKIARSILGGELGYGELGKVISIYPNNNQQALELAKMLITITLPFKGPEIPTDRRLGSVVYTRYGACRPILQTNVRGGTDEYIYDSTGNLIKDQQTIPFILPKDTEWPFSTIVPAKAPKKERVLQDKYKPISLLKDDAKGNVKKALWLKRFYQVKWCVVKEGKQNMSADSQGRDISERLRWQFQLHKSLEESIPIPRIYDFFQENGDTYLVMQYINGSDLSGIVTNIYENRMWWQLPLSGRLLLLDYATQIIEIIGKMHQKGYIHRDVTPANFLVTKQQKLWMIDLELSFSTQLNKPFPPFRLGTPGFMSPEQEDVLIPAVEQDIYSIGALLIVLLSGMYPRNFATKNLNTLRMQLLFFIPDTPLVNILSACFNEQPDLRPKISIIKEAVLKFCRDQSVVSYGTEREYVKNKLSKEELKELITNALRGLVIQNMMNKDQLWLSKDSQTDYYQSESKIVYEGFYEGLSGILYLLAKAHITGLDITPCSTSYQKSIQYLRENYWPNLSNFPAGLFGGTAGVALALGAGIESGLISNNAITKQEIHSYILRENADGCGIVKGTSGQGMALLYLLSLQQNDILVSFLHSQVDDLIKQQQKDGTWLAATDDKKKSLKVTGFGHGAAGIICFLLGYSKRYKNTASRLSATKALEWLMKKAHKENGELLWHINDKSKEADSWMQNGIVGITLAFIKAYEVLKEPSYKQIAEIILRNIPIPLVERDLTLANGIAGVGELFLEAANTFRAQEWQDKADWIVQFFFHQFYQEKDGSCYWMTDTTSVTTADFMTGNSGIIHFLLRYYEPERLYHPYLFW